MQKRYIHRKLFSYRYPKLTVLLIISIITYVVFSKPIVQGFFTHLGNLSYLGILIGGILFSFGFTTPIAIGVFLVSNPSNIYLAAIIGGLGAMLSDLFILSVIRATLMDEFRLLEKTKIIKESERLFKSKIHGKIKLYLLFVFAGIIIASPLPDELGVGILAGFTRIRVWVMAIISFAFNSLGILVMLCL
ncbi:MAG: hypothetical protein WCK90_04830 [archaeon]